MIEPFSFWIWLPPVSAGAHNVWGRFDHERPTYDLGQILLVFAAAVVVAATGLVLSRWRGRFCSNSPRALFRELCRAHGLRGSSRRLLKRLATSRGLTSPAALFVEPRHFDTQDLPPALQSAGTELQRLHDRLFK